MLKLVRRIKVHQNLLVLVAVALQGVALVQAQFTPPIENYPPGSYRADNQNWAIDQAENGLLFIANQSRILIFDGNRWQSEFVPGSQNVRKLRVVGDRLYVGGSMSAGSFEITSKGLNDFKTIQGLEQQSIAVGEEFWEIISHRDQLFFQSKTAIYRIQDHRVVEKKSFLSDRPEGFEAEQMLYFFGSQGASLKYSSLGFEILSSDSLDAPIVGQYVINDQRFFIDERSLSYRIADRELLKSEQQLLTIEDENRLYDLVQIESGLIMAGTIASGLQVFDTAGKQLYSLSRRTGLLNNTVLTLFESRSHRVWLGLDQGIASFAPATNLLAYRYGFDDLGVVYTAIQHQGILYIGTNQGLYRYQSSSDSFQFIEQTRGQVWDLKVLHNKLYCFHDKGLFEVSSLKASQISSATGFWTAEPFEGELNPSYILGGYDGVYRYTEGSAPEKIEGFDVSSRFLSVARNQLVVNHEKLGLFFLELDANAERIEAQKNIATIGSATSLFTLNEHIFYRSTEGIFEVDTKDKVLRFQKNFSNQLNFKTIRPSKSTVTPNGAAFLGENRVYQLYSKGAIIDSVVEVPLPKSRLASFGVSGFENLNYLEGQRFLIGLRDGFMLVDTAMEVDPPPVFPIWLSEVAVVRQDNFIERELNDQSSLPFSSNTLRVVFKHPQFGDRFRAGYRFSLQSEAGTVSEESDTPDKIYYNLDPGTYSLTVSAIDTSGNLLTTSSPFEFTIDNPWYQTTQFSLYLVAAALLLFVIASTVSRAFYKRRERKITEANAQLIENNQLKERDRLNQLKTRHLESELELRKRELTGVYEAEIRRNALLKELKTRLERSEQSKKSLDSVIAHIDKHLEDDSDWKKFENAFNELDFEFVANLHKRHQGLTRQEVRLLVYIRLNLSNKEISQLLNIGLKSVEMKRYRVRKKLELLKSESLTEYIHSF